MLEELFDKVAELFKKEEPVTTVVDGKTYSIKGDRTLGDYVRPPAPLDKPTLNVRTLSGFVDAYNASIDAFPADGVAVQVENFDSVALVSMAADEFGKRHVWVRAKATDENPFRFGAYQQIEDFLIALQAGFVPSDNTTALARLCSSVTAGNSVSVADDGISQSVTVTEGTMQRGSVTVPNRLPLSPYRTFREVEPVASDFLIRMKPVKDNLPTVALLEVDGGRWKLDTILAVGLWLSLNLPIAARVIA